MALAANAIMVFTAYTVTDTGIQLSFVCSNPGGGNPSDYTIFLTDLDISQVVTNAQLQTLVTTALKRRYRATGIATKLDPFIGQSVVI